MIDVFRVYLICGLSIFVFVFWCVHNRLGLIVFCHFKSSYIIIPFLSKRFILYFGLSTFSLLSKVMSFYFIKIYYSDLGTDRI